MTFFSKNGNFVFMIRAITAILGNYIHTILGNHAQNHCSARAPRASYTTQYWQACCAGRLAVLVLVC